MKCECRGWIASINKYYIRKGKGNCNKCEIYYSEHRED